MINTYRTTILKDDIYIGIKVGYKIIVRPITSGCQIYANLDFNDNLKKCPGVIKMKAIAPPLFLVIYGNVRLDGFLSKKNAMSYAKKFLNA